MADDQAVLVRADMLTAAACAPAAMSADQVEEAVNAQSPTGIASRWVVSPQPFADTGQPSPVPCLDDPHRRHWLLEC